MNAHSFVAMGDSFTEGLDDPYPQGSAYRGWADLVAARLAAEVPAGTFQYANLAIRGKLFTAVVEEQVPAGLTMRPDVFAFAAGGNDALRRGFDVAALIARFDQVVAALRATGAEVLLFRFIDVSQVLPGKRLLRPRVEAMNHGVVATALRHGARVVDLWNDPAFGNPALWSADRLHLGSVGHQRVAAHVLTALGVAPDQRWLAAPPPPPTLAWTSARSADLRWAREHLGPWIGRRLTGRSSGDTRTAKRPALAPVEANPFG